MPRCSISAPVRDGEFFPPVIGREVEVFGTNEIAYAAALVGFFDAGPEAVEFVRS